MNDYVNPYRILRTPTREKSGPYGIPEEEIPIIFIEWMEVHRNQRRKGYGTYILIYGILSVLCIPEFNNIKYIKLDDSTDNITDIKNIYAGLHIVSETHSSIVSSKNTDMTGPEKHVYIGLSDSVDRNAFLRLMHYKSRATRHYRTNHKSTRRSHNRSRSRSRNRSRNRSHNAVSY